MSYQPDDDPFLAEEESEAGSVIAPPKPKRKPKALPQQNQAPHSQPPPANYQYQPQSMYNIPNGQPPRGPQSAPSFMMNRPGMVPGPGPMLRQTPSFYVEPGAQQPPYVMMPPPQPYGMPPPPMGYGPPPAVYIQPAPPVYAPPASVGGYRDRTTLSEQIEELERYHRIRPPSHNNNAADNSLLIATLVSEQDSLYGTNMLENITPMDQEYIQSLMQRGVPEHEALRMAFDRKPHALVPPKVTSRVVDSEADAHALEQAIQLSLTESSRRASQPDRPTMGLGAASTDRVDQEALEKAIQLSLSEQQRGRKTYQADTGYSVHASSAYGESSQYSAQHSEQGQYSQHHRRTGSGGGGSGNYGYAAAASYRDDASQLSDDQSYYSEAPAPETFDRQYPYNLTREAPVEVLKKTYSVSGVDKYRLAQQQQQEYFDHLQAGTARSQAGPHAGSQHGGASRSTYTTQTHTQHIQQHAQQQQQSARGDNFDEYAEHRSVTRGAEDLRARAYGAGPSAAPPASYRASPSSLSPVPDYGSAGGYDRQYPYNIPPEERMRPVGYGEPQYDEYSGSSRSRSDSGGEEPYDGPVQYTADQRAQYNRGGYDRSGSSYNQHQSEYVQEERREDYHRQEYPPPQQQQPAYQEPYQAPRPSTGRMQAPPRQQPYGLSPPPAYGNGDESDEEGKMDPPPRLQPPRSGGGYSSTSSAYSERIVTTAAPTYQRTLERAPSARDLRPPQRDDMSETSYGRSTVQSAAPPMMDAGNAGRFQAERDRFLQQTQQQRTLQSTTRTSTVTSSSDYSSASSRPPAMVPPGYGGGARGQARGIAAADLDDAPPEFAEDDFQQTSQKHEWRNTLKRLVNNLTEDSDEEN